MNQGQFVIKITIHKQLAITFAVLQTYLLGPFLFRFHLADLIFVLNNFDNSSIYTEVTSTILSVKIKGTR